MTNANFQIKKESETTNHGIFVFEPLQKGYGDTLGNALRRVLLTSLPGAAISEIKINGIKHKFSTLEGLKEDIVQLILNIKQIRVKYSGEKPIKMQLEKTGPGQVTAEDIKSPAQVEIINKELVLGNLSDKKSKLKVSMTVESGYGYLPAEERKSDKIGVIPVDSLFTPIRRVNYRVEATRVGRRTDLDRLILEIFTDGTIKPSLAVKKSAKILVKFFDQVVNPKKIKKQEETKKAPNEALGLIFEEIGIPTRIANALRKGGFQNLGDLTEATIADLLKVKNVGQKSIKVIRECLAKKKLDLKEGKDET